MRKIRLTCYYLSGQLSISKTQENDSDEIEQVEMLIVLSHFGSIAIIRSVRDYGPIIAIMFNRARGPATREAADSFFTVLGRLKIAFSQRGKKNALQF